MLSTHGRCIFWSVFYFVREKTQANVSMPVCDALYDLFRYRFRVKNIDGNQVFYLGKQYFYKEWKRAVRKSDMSWKPRPTDLRHFFASYLLNNGKDHLMIAGFMGHASLDMLLKRYGHFTDQTRRGAILKLDRGYANSI